MLFSSGLDRVIYSNADLVGSVNRSDQPSQRENEERGSQSMTTKKIYRVVHYIIFVYMRGYIYNYTRGPYVNSKYF